MAKKRKTRSQKARSAVRRQRLLAINQPLPSKQHIAAATVTKPKAPAENSAHQRDLRRTLLLLALLIAVQLVIWLIFRSTRLDEWLYNWLPA